VALFTSLIPSDNEDEVRNQGCVQSDTVMGISGNTAVITAEMGTTEQ